MNGKLVYTDIQRKRMTLNFVEKYGEVRLYELLGMYENGMTLAAIAKKFNVSRERVRQWKGAFVDTVTTTTPSEAVRVMLG